MSRSCVTLLALFSVATILFANDGRNQRTFGSHSRRTGGAKTITSTFDQVPGSALLFNGTDDYVGAVNPTVPVGNSCYTIEAWIKPNSMGSLGIVGWGNYGNDNDNQVNAFRLNGSPDDALMNYWWANDITASVGDISGVWHHVVASFDGTARKIYLDGAVVASDAPSGHNVPNSANFKIGQTCASCNGGEVFDGIIDEVRIWNVARTPQEIRENMYRTLSGTQSGLLEYWQFNEGTDTTTFDCASGDTGTLYNFAMNSTSGWVTATEPVGGGSSASVFSATNGTDTLGTIILTTSTPFTNPVNLTATQILAPPDSMPSGSTTLLADRYWVLNSYDGDPGSFSLNLSFTVPPSFTNNGSGNPSLYTLYTRPATGDGGWTTAVSGAASVAATTVTFDGVTTLGQYALGTNDALPIQLASLTANAVANNVNLQWTTVSETNSLGFYVERKAQNSGTFATASNLITGAGTTLQQHHYQWTDTKVTDGNYNYRLRLVDLNGATAYSNAIAVTVSGVLGVGAIKPLPTEFALHQNYPNPFNPSTVINYDLPKAAYVHLTMYDMLGREVATLVNGTQDAGYKSVEFSAANLPSGIYTYRLTAGTYVEVKKMLLLK